MLCQDQTEDERSSSGCYRLTYLHKGLEDKKSIPINYLSDLVKQFTFQVPYVQNNIVKSFFKIY